LYILLANILYAHPTQQDLDAGWSVLARDIETKSGLVSGMACFSSASVLLGIAMPEFN
jgi:hypothetical protein